MADGADLVVREAHRNGDEKNSCCTVYFQIGLADLVYGQRSGGC